MRSQAATWPHHTVTPRATALSLPAPAGDLLSKAGPARPSEVWRLESVPTLSCLSCLSCPCQTFPLTGQTAGYRWTGRSPIFGADQIQRAVRWLTLSCLQCLYVTHLLLSAHTNVTSSLLQIKWQFLISIEGEKSQERKHKYQGVNLVKQAPIEMLHDIVNAICTSTLL